MYTFEWFTVTGGLVEADCFIGNGQGLRRKRNNNNKQENTTYLITYKQYININQRRAITRPCLYIHLACTPCCQHVRQLEIQIRAKDSTRVKRNIFLF